MGKRPETNEEILAKALIEADALASAGELQPQEAEKFLDWVIDETALKQNARVIKISKGDKWRVNKIGVGRRNAVPATAGVDPGIRRGINTGVVPLETAEIMLPFDIGDGFIERNIEGMSARDHIVRMMATAFSNDWEELLLLGDLLGHARIEGDILEGGDETRYVKDEYLGLFDGLLRLADGGQVVDVEGENMGVGIMRQAITAMPTKYRRNRNDLRLYTPTDILELWRERVSTRATALGDAATTGGNPAPKPFGLTPADLALLPFNPLHVEHVQLNGTTPVALRSNPIQNVVVTASTIGGTKPVDAYTVGVDYSVDLVAGTVTRIGGAIGDGQVVKVTYESNPQLIVTHRQNIIIAISRDVRIERDRNIHRRVSEFVITGKVAIGIENLDAMVKLKNVGTGV
jgi:hypothetical protein